MRLYQFHQCVRSKFDSEKLQLPADLQCTELACSTDIAWGTQYVAKYGMRSRHCMGLFKLHCMGADIDHNVQLLLMIYLHQPYKGKLLAFGAAAGQ